MLGILHTCAHAKHLNLCAALSPWSDKPLRKEKGWSVGVVGSCQGVTQPWGADDACIALCQRTP